MKRNCAFSGGLRAFPVLAALSNFEWKANNMMSKISSKRKPPPGLQARQGFISVVIKVRENLAGPHPEVVSGFSAPVKSLARREAGHA